MLSISSEFFFKSLTFQTKNKNKLLILSLLISLINSRQANLLDGLCSTCSFLVSLRKYFLTTICCFSINSNPPTISKLLSNLPTVGTQSILLSPLLPVLKFYAVNSVLTLTYGCFLLIILQLF